MNEYIYSQITAANTVQSTKDKTETDRKYEQNTAPVQHVNNITHPN